MTRKSVTVFQPNEPLPPQQVHAGWGKAKRKMDTAGAVKTEMARLYKRAAAGLMDSEELKAAIWTCRQIAEIAEKAELEARIVELERKLSEALTHAR